MKNGKNGTGLKKEQVGYANEDKGTLTTHCHALPLLF